MKEHDAGEHMERLSATYQELCRTKKLSAEQTRIKELYESLLLLLSDVDWDHPHAVDLARIEAGCLKWGRLAEDLSPKQRQEISTVPYLVGLGETLRVHEEAIFRREWGNVDYTLRQLMAIQRQYNNQVYSRINTRILGPIQNTKKGGKASAAARQKHSEEEVRAKFAQLMERHSNNRAKAVCGLAKELKLKPNSTNKLLRRYGLGLRNIHIKKRD